MKSFYELNYNIIYNYDEKNINYQVLKNIDEIRKSEMFLEVLDLIKYLYQLKLILIIEK